ncbi:MAG: hypothetical protein RLZZ491_2073, partial [Pseudomonadota bacterium]
SVGIAINQDGQRRTGMDILAIHDVSPSHLDSLIPAFAHLPAETREQLAIDAMYKTYVERQARDAAGLARDEAQPIPEHFDYASIGGLSNELKGKLERTRPRSLGQAGRIDGMTPAALALILSRIRQNERRTA